MKYKKLISAAILTILWSTISIAQINAPSPHPDRLVLNLTEEPYSSMALTWRTDTSIPEGFCELQLAPEGPVSKEKTTTYKANTSRITYTYEEEPAITANQHSFIFTNLEPGKKYIYRAGYGEYWSEWIEFRTPTEDSTNFSFIYFGDPQSDLKSQWSRVIRAAYSKKPEAAFMLYCGDLINRAGRDSEWHEWFYAGSFIFAMIPQVMTPGNHDYSDRILDPHWNAQFTQPQNGPKGLEGTCFVIDFKNLRLISIDSAADSELRYEKGNKLQLQKVWLDSVLQVNPKEWTVVTTHLPFYSPKENRDNNHLRKHFQPILEKHKVDLVLSGHDHSYARGRHTDNPRNGHEVMYVVSVSGPKMYEAGDKDWMDHSGSFIQLYQVISIENNELNYQAFTADGALFDQFLLRKEKDGSFKATELKPN